MFSLIITIISIALVAALALATLYYGGSSWTRGNAAASAATVTNQGQQIRGAMELYYADHSAYPASLQDLVTGEYLKTIPVPPATAALEPGLVAPALAADEVWTLLAGGQPAFMVQDAISKDVCQELNFLNLGSDAIRAKIDPTKAYQCFGEAEGPFTFISGVPGPDDALASLRQAVIEYNTAHDPDLPMVTDADPSNLVTVAETKNKNGTASAPPAEGEAAPSGVFLEDFAGAGAMSGKAPTQSAVEGALWQENWGGTFVRDGSGKYVSYNNWDYDELYLESATPLVSGVGVIEVKVSPGGDRTSTSSPQVLGEFHFHSVDSELEIDVQLKGWHETVQNSWLNDAETGPWAFTDIQFGMWYGGNYYTGNFYEEVGMPLGDKTLRIELSDTVQQLYFNGRLVGTINLALPASARGIGEIYIQLNTDGDWDDATSPNPIGLDYVYMSPDRSYRLPAQYQ